MGLGVDDLPWWYDLELAPGGMNRALRMALMCQMLSRHH